MRDYPSYREYLSYRRRISEYHLFWYMRQLEQKTAVSELNQPVATCEPQAAQQRPKEYCYAHLANTESISIEECNRVMAWPNKFQQKYDDMLRNDLKSKYGILEELKPDGAGKRQHKHRRVTTASFFAFIRDIDQKRQGADEAKKPGFCHAMGFPQGIGASGWDSFAMSVTSRDAAATTVLPADAGGLAQSVLRLALELARATADNDQSQDEIRRLKAEKVEKRRKDDEANARDKQRMKTLVGRELAEARERIAQLEARENKARPEVKPAKTPDQKRAHLRGTIFFTGKDF